MDAAGWGATEAESAQSAAQLPFSLLHPFFPSFFFPPVWLERSKASGWMLEISKQKKKHKKQKKLSAVQEV